MRRPAFFLAIILFFPLLGHSQTETLAKMESDLASAKSDTAKISLLSKMSRQNPHHGSALAWARKAYSISSSQSNLRYKALADETLGMALKKIKPDSSKLLMRRAIQNYEKAGLTTNTIDAIRSYGRVLEENESFDSAYYFFDEALAQSEKAGYERGKGDSYYAIARIENRRGNNILALKHAKQAKEHYLKAGLIKETGQALNQIGIIYDFMGLYPEALDHYLQAKEIAEETKDNDNLIIITNNLGVIYDNLKNPKQALKYYNEAMELSGIYSQNPEDKALLLNNVSYIHLSSGDTLQAIKSLWGSLEIVRSNSIPCFGPYPMEGLADIYIRSGNYDSAKYYIEKSIKKAKECDDVSVLTTLYRDQGRLAAATGNQTDANVALQKALQLSRSANLVVDTQESLFELFKLNKAKGNQAMALYYLELHQQFKDSLNISKTEERAAQLAAEYDFRKQVELLEHDRKDAEFRLINEMTTQKREYSIILIATILLGLFSIALGRFYLKIQGQNKNLIWLNEEKNTLIGVVAHDLRNPLNMIKGLMGIIQETKGTLKEEELNQYHQMIASTTDRMSEMISKVLDITAIENMKLNLNLTKTDLTKSLSRASHNFSQIAKQKKITITNQFDPTVHQFALVDSQYLDQILDNLISNAIKFSKEGKSIRLRVSTVENGYKLISIADEGPGISQADQERMFQKFTKLKARPTNNEKSTGLGLSIVQRYVNAMQGEILCKSELHVGTTFEIKFKPA